MSNKEKPIKYELKALENVAIRTEPIPKDEYLKGEIYQGKICQFIDLVTGTNYEDPETKKSSDKWYIDRNGDFYWSGGFEKRQSITTTIYDPMSFWWIEKYNIPELWKHGLTGKGVKVAILDSGLDLPHPDLVIDLSKTSDQSNSPKKGIHDLSGHGTHCVGIIKGSNNGFGVKGIAYDCDLYFCKITNDKSKDKFFYLEKGLDWAVKQGVDVISISHGKSNPKIDLSSKFQTIAEQNNIICVASGGNQNPDLEEFTDILQPAKYKHCVAVGAVDPDGRFLNSSIASPNLDISGPGFEILSTFLSKDYKKMTGTSQATPFIAGVIALLLQYLKEKNKVISPKKIKELLIDTGDRSSPCPIINPIQALNKLKEIEI